MNVKRIKRLGVWSKEVEQEIKKRTETIFAIKVQKGKYAKRWNSYITGTPNKNVLTFRKADILELFGQYKSIDQVYETIKNDWTFSIKRDKLTDFYYENLQDIQERRVRFQSQEKDFYLSTGTGRIESLSYLFTEMMKLFDQTKQIKYSTEIRGIIEQVRKEVKGDEIS